MSDIDSLLDKLDGEFRFDTGQVLLNLVQYSIRNRKYLELILRNQLEAREYAEGKGRTREEIEDLADQRFEDTLEEIQKEVEKEYFDLLSFLSSRNK